MSITLSAFWHLLVLLVLTLAVHPFELPDQQPVIVDLLPPLTTPPTPTVEVQLRPRPAVRPPLPAAQPSPEVPPQTPPTETRPAPPSVQPPAEVERRTVQAPRLQTQPAAPQIPEAPPEPVEVTRQAPTLQPQMEVPRAQAQSRPLDTSRAAPPTPQATAPETPAPQVLTNQTVIQAPTEIRPRERAPAAPPVTSRPGAAEIPTPGGGAPSAGGQGRAGRPSAEDFKGLPNLSGGAGAKGLGQATGCEDPDVYKQSSEERAACLQRFGQRARATPDLGLPIPAGKKADYDRVAACQAYKRQGIPGANDATPGSSIRGLGSNPSLKDCPPGDR